ncbi:MAG: hypothetical protein KF690_00880 [Bacteroidetes bacterium]|nr:hypothetical protein [Bacteroidota bacterium]
MKSLLSLLLMLAMMPLAQANNDRDKKSGAATCADCETAAPCQDCDAATLAPCADCETAAVATPSAPPVAAAAPVSRKEARQAWQAMSKEERREAKSKLRDFLKHTPLGMATSELAQQVNDFKAHGNNTADYQVMMMDETIRILLIILLVLVCVSLLIGIL